MSSARAVFGALIVFIAAAAGSSCTTDDEPGQACNDFSVCAPAATIKIDLPIFTFAAVQKASITVCRNDDCHVGSFSAINAPPSPLTGVGVALPSTLDGGAAPGPSALLMATNDMNSFWLQVFWPVTLGATPADGDKYSLTVRDESGAEVTGFDATVTKYAVAYPFGKDCPTTCQYVVLDRHTS